MERKSVTRREFLHRFGAIGGSSMVFGAMDVWGLTGAAAGARPGWSRSDRAASVIVLGGGLSGMAAALELGKLGYDARVLEARYRVGGLNHTVRRGTEETEITGRHQKCEFDDGLYYNAGPWRIPNSHTAVLNYCKELGVPLQVFINEHDDAPMYFEDERAGELAGRKMKMREVKADLRGYTSELLAKAVSQHMLDAPMSKEDAEKLVEYLVWEGYLESPDIAYRGSEARGKGTPYNPMTLLNSGIGRRMRAVEAVGNTRAPMFQPIGGMDQIPMAFGRALGDKITLGAEVQRVRQTDDNVTVVYKDRGTGQVHELTADYAVLALPFTIMQTLDINFSPEMADAVANIHHASSAKIGLQMGRRFWEEDEGIFGGAAYTDLPIGQFGYPSNDFFGSKGTLLGFYGSDDLGNVRELTPEARLEHVLSNAEKFHPQIRGAFETGYSAVWSQIPYSLGAYAHGPGNYKDQVNQADGRLYLGSAAVSGDGGWMEGAFASAWATVDRLHRRVSA